MKIDLSQGADRPAVTFTPPPLMLRSSSQIVRQAAFKGKKVEDQRVRKAQLAVRKRIIQELRETEERFVAGLLSVSRDLIQPLQMAQVITDDDFTAVFGNLQVLLGHHQALLKILQTFEECNPDTDPIGTRFLEGVGTATLQSQ
jgi:hypothetical protein